MQEKKNKRLAILLIAMISVIVILIPELFEPRHGCREINALLRILA